MKSVKAILIIKQCEGCRLKPYLCPAGIPTIGWGSTRYPNGVRVSMKDPAITQAKADEMLLCDLKAFEADVTSLTKSVKLNQNQFDALVDFSYNCGVGNLRSSTLLKKVLSNPNDTSISLEFAKWNKGNGKVLPGLVKRRKLEADLYFS